MGGILSRISLLNLEADQRRIMQKNAKGKSRIYGHKGFLFRLAVTGISAYK